MGLKKTALFHAKSFEMTTTYTFKFPDGKTVVNPQGGVTRSVEDIICEAAKRNGGSSAGNKTNRGMRTMKVCLTGKNEKNSEMFGMECAVFKPEIKVT